MQQLIQEMLDAMYDVRGIGLAAQQVGHALQLCVVDVRDAKDRPSTLEIDGEPQDVASIMPLVLVNPQIEPSGEIVVGPEGCLSFPEIYADIPRPALLEVQAFDAEGKPYRFRCGGLLSRAIQHEWDHLQGILFIDRMTRETKDGLREELLTLQAQTKAMLASQPQPS
jgi:peptide deformylase